MARRIGNEAVTFSVIGDVPYGSSEISVFQQHMDDHNLYSPSDFMVHVGDILAGTESCNESRYQTVANILQTLAVPAFIVPGDNETTDCDDPAEGWSFWVTHLMGIEQAFCGVPQVERQSARPENFAFTRNGVLFIGIHLVGGSNDAQLMQDDADWVDQQLQAHGSTVRAAVVFAQAGPGGNRTSFFDPFEIFAAAFGKPLLYIHGDGHTWIQDNPFQPSNVTRVQVDRGDEPPVAVSVDLSGQFSFERDPWPNGTPLLNREPCVNAGADTSLVGPGSLLLAGMATDDGVPNNPANLSLTWSQVGGPPGASFVDPTAANTMATLPDDGTYLFQLTANDGALAASDTVLVFVGTPPNQPAVAGADSFATVLNTLLSVPAPGVLGNDFDPDSDPITAILEAATLHGTLNLFSDGSFTYMPDLAFAGIDSFSYRADDGNAPSAPAVAMIAVAESSVVSWTLSDDAYVNGGSSSANFGDDPELRVEDDSSPDVSFLKFSVSGTGNAVQSALLRLRVTNPSNDGGTVHLVSNDYNGTSTPWNEAGLVWNNAPQIVNPALDSAGSVSTGEWVELDVSAAIPGDGIYSFVIENSSSNSVRYSSKEGNDPPELVVQAAPPNAPPVASADSFSVDEDAILVVANPGVLVNDADANGDSLTALAGNPAANGALDLSTGGGFTYTPTPNFAGVDSFTYIVSDGRGGQHGATVFLTVNALSDDPVAMNDTYGSAEDSTLVIAAPGVLQNDSDADGDSLFATLVSGPTFGSLALFGDGGFTFTPPPDFNGPASFTYSVDDGVAADTATATISVAAAGDPPTAAADTFVVIRGRTLVVGAPGILFNDGDVDGDTLQAALASNVSLGALQLDAQGAFTYDAPASFLGTDTFTYTASDGILESGEASVLIRVVAREVALQSTRGAGVENDRTLSTQAPLLPVVDELYLVAIACRPLGTVQSVQGLGLNWIQQSSQCSGRSTAAIEVWTALGTPTFGNVTVTLDQPADHAALHVSRWAGVDPSDPVRTLVTGNTNGAHGRCSGGTDDSTYSFVLPAGRAGGVTVGFVEAGMQAHQPENNFIVIDSVMEGDSISGTSLLIASRDAATTAVTWSGSFAQAVDWTAAAVEVRPPPPGPGLRRRTPAVLMALPSNPVVGGAALSYRLREPMHVAVHVYDVRGRLVRQVVNTVQSPGLQNIVWDTHTESGQRAGSGVYFLKLRLGSRTHVQKLILVR